MVDLAFLVFLYSVIVIFDGNPPTGALNTGRV